MNVLPPDARLNPASLLFVFAPLLACSAAAPPADDRLGEPGQDAPSAVILDAFFGLDDALLPIANALCPGASGMDGLPVTLSRRVKPDSPEATSFVVITRGGQRLTPRCATLRPADDPTERHTVLLIGALGDEPEDPPARVEIVGSVPLLGGGDAMGASTDVVTPLADGPSLRIAYRYAPEELPKSSCPRPTTAQIVQITWAGGVKATTGAELGDPERPRMSVTLEDGAVVTPIALGDIGDNDNYTHLCLDSASVARSVTVEAGVAADPRGDANPETTIQVTNDPEATR
jgi:hypothetical protein